MALSLLGLQPSDVNLLPVGAADVALQTLVSGQANAAAFPPPFSFQAEARGFVDLQDTFDTPYLTNGVVALRSRLDEMSMQMAAVVAAIREGVNAFYAQPDLAIQTISKRTGEDDAAVLKKTYDFFNTKVRFDATLVPRAESLQGMLDFLACHSIEKLVIDAEAIASAQRLIEGIEPRGDSLATAMFAQTGLTGDFLKLKETRSLFRQEQHFPSTLIDRGLPATDGASRGILDRAQERVEDLIQTYERRPLAREREKEIIAFAEREGKKAGLPGIVGIFQPEAGLTR